MIKAIALLKARSDLPREEFMRYYETRHVPLVRSLLPETLEYRRNYIQLEGAYIYEGASPPDFDVITEMWYADRPSYERMMAIATRPEIAQRIAEDELNFLDRSRTRMFLVEERGAP
ncbi:MAG: EthD domain-containing protein [Gammaproteobacteria bacterium]|nr:EthD domain-containing protein [Gammaproteobacteria bacterium]